jgi:hypothetical protein
MTVSRNDRVADLADALRKMTEDVGENAVWRVDISIESERYRHVRATTWKELLDRGLIKWFFHNTYQLTTIGWRKGVQLLELDKDPEFRGKLSRLAATLKDQVKGRYEEAYLDLFHAAQLSELTEDFICNIIESRLLDHCFNMKGARLDTDNTIVIPIDFGMEPL